MAALPPTLHFLLIPLPLVLLVLSTPSPSLLPSSSTELQARIFCLSSTTSLGAFLLLLHRNCVAATDPRWLEGLLGGLASLWWAGFILPPTLLTHTRSSLSPVVVALTCVVTALVLLSWALFLADWVRHGSAGPVGLIRLEDDDQAGACIHEKSEGTSAEVKSERCAWTRAGQVVLQVVTFVGVAGGAARCLVAAGWLSVRLQIYTPATLFALPAFLAIVTLFLPAHRTASLISLTLILQSHGTTTHRIRLCTLVCESPIGDALLGHCSASRSLHLGSLVLLASLAIRLIVIYTTPPAPCPEEALQHRSTLREQYGRRGGGGKISLV